MNFDDRRDDVIDTMYAYLFGMIAGVREFAYERPEEGVA